MAKEELESSIKLHVREVLFNVTEMPDVKYSFEELGEDTFSRRSCSRASPRRDDPGSGAPHPGAGDRDGVLGDIDRVIAPASHPVLAAQKLTLTPPTASSSRVWTGH